MTPTYQTGFGNYFESESIAGALPAGRNSPQCVAHGLYAELFSGTAFTAERANNRRTWLYRRLPSAVCADYTPLAAPLLRTGTADIALGAAATPPNPLRWLPLAQTLAQPTTMVQGLATLLGNGDADAQTGMAVHLLHCNASMENQAFINTDGEMLFVPQQGALHFTTELGLLQAAPGQIVVIPRGMVFALEVLGDTVAYVCENYGAPFRLPELGPIGSNGLANLRDFCAPVASVEVDAPTTIIKKFAGQLWQAQQAHSPFNVVAWHGNCVPYLYDTAHFNTLGSVSFDHPDPSIYTVLTSPSDTVGAANCDFVIFPPRWLVAENTFRPPWFHRNVMSECMGLVHGQYDAKPQGFKPGGLSLHNSHVPHGPDADAFEKASNADLKPHKLDNTLAFMFESRLRMVLSPYALGSAALDKSYAACWRGLQQA
jgi:homogentisate 1,2-dioxygenase